MNRLEETALWADLEQQAESQDALDTDVAVAAGTENTDALIAMLADGHVRRILIRAEKAAEGTDGAVFLIDNVSTQVLEERMKQMYARMQDYHAEAPEHIDLAPLLPGIAASAKKRLFSLIAPVESPIGMETTMEVLKEVDARHITVDRKTPQKQLSGYYIPSRLPRVRLIYAYDPQTQACSFEGLYIKPQILRRKV